MRVRVSLEKIVHLEVGQVQNLSHQIKKSYATAKSDKDSGSRTMMATKLTRIVWAATLLLAFAACVFAQDDPPVNLNPIKWSAKTDAARPVKVGEQFAIQLTAEIEEGWHLYSTEEMPMGPKPTRIGLAANQPFEADSVESPEPKTSFDENFGISTEYYENSVTFSLPVKATAKAAAGKQKVTVQVRYQTCTDKLCLPPKLVKLDVEVEIKPEK